MRVCMLAYTFYETDNRVRRYAETLARRGDTVDAIALRRPGQASFEVIRGVNVYRIQNRTVDEKHPLTYLFKLLAFFFRSFWRLSINQIRHGYNVVHVHSIPDFLVFAALVPRLAGASIILDIHDIVPELYASKFRVSQKSILFRALLLVERWSIAFSHHTIVANHLWSERIISRSAPATKCSTILNYPDLSIFAPERYKKPSSKDAFVLCYPGTLSWHQGVDLIISAMALLKDKMPELRLIVFGDGPERPALSKMIEQLSLQDKVTIGSGVAIEKVAEAMVNVDLGVEPKRKSTFGDEALSTKILEFMAMRVPVLASETTINRRYFDDNTLEYFRSEDIEDLANGILRLARDERRRTALSEHGVQFVQENNWTVKMHEYLGLVDRLQGATVALQDKRADVTSLSTD